MCEREGWPLNHHDWTMNHDTKLCFYLLYLLMWNDVRKLTVSAIHTLLSWTRAGSLITLSPNYHFFLYLSIILNRDHKCKFVIFSCTKKFQSSNCILITLNINWCVWWSAWYIASTHLLWTVPSSYYTKNSISVTNSKSQV